MNKRIFVMAAVLALLTTVSLADDVITVCGQNVQNFFYSLDRERTQSNGVPLSNYTTAEGRTAKAQAIVQALAPYTADIYAFNEVEAKPEGADTEAMEILADEMSKVTGHTYSAVSDDLTYDLASDASGVIKSGFIYRTDKVEPVGKNVSTAVGYAYIYPLMMRLQTFRSLASGEQFSLSMNHFKASTSEEYAEDVAKRELNSIALLKGLNQATDPDILVLGDLNSVMGEQCLRNLTDAGYEEQILKWEGPNAYSHWFDSGSLIDHVFANSTMAKQVTDARILYIANVHSVGKKNAYSDHDPYLVTLNLKAQPAATYHYTRAVTMTPGVPYLMVAPINGFRAAQPVAPEKSYEYQLTTSVTDVDGVITMSDAKQAFIFEDTGDGSYHIKDYYGRYVYQFLNTSSNKYTSSTNMGVQADAHPFTVTPQADGTFKILNTISNCYYIALTYNSTPQFALYNYTSLRSGQYLPWLYAYDPNAAPTGISDADETAKATSTRKLLINGHLLIVTPDGRRYNIQGIELR